jgi:Na+-transporting NADH:ubiquinone oxidoreductase subunit NqrD
MLSQAVFPSETPDILIYLQCLVANSLILERFDKRPFKRIRYKLIFTVSATLGFDIALLIFASFREIISFGTFYGNPVGVWAPLPAFGAVFGGFILLSFFAALYRQITKFAENLKVGLKND